MTHLTKVLSELEKTLERVSGLTIEQLRGMTLSEVRVLSESRGNPVQVSGGDWIVSHTQVEEALTQALKGLL